MSDVDELALDEPDALERRDPAGMLRATATAGAQIREALLHTPTELLERLASDGRPRAVVVSGMGGSGVVGDLAAAVVGPACPVPVLVHRGYQLPGWVGAMDLVVTVSCSGETDETLAVTDEALRRGCRVVTVGAATSSLAARAEHSPAVHVPVQTGGRMPRANLWALAVPVLLLLDALRLADVPRELLDRVADRLDATSEQCGPRAEIFDNPAKRIAASLAGSLPYVWGTSDVTAVAAARFAAQLAENAKYPAVPGALPEAGHNACVVLAGPFGALASDPDDIFRDPVEDGGSLPVRMKLLVLRDTSELAPVARRRKATRKVADRFRVAVEEVPAAGDHPLERLASLIGPLDFASVYLALLLGIDPSPIEPIVALKAAAGSRTEEDDQ